MQSFPELSRAPAIKTANSLAADPTLRDQMQSGAEATALQFPRGREQWDITIELLPADDVATLKSFLRTDAVYGVNPFLWQDNTDPTNPVERAVRFSTLPSFRLVAAAEGLRWNCTFQLREL